MPLSGKDFPDLRFFEIFDVLKIFFEISFGLLWATNKRNLPPAMNVGLPHGSANDRFQLQTDGAMCFRISSPFK